MLKHKTNFDILNHTDFFESFFRGRGNNVQRYCYRRSIHELEKQIQFCVSFIALW